MDAFWSMLLLRSCIPFSCKPINIGDLKHVNCADLSPTLDTKSETQSPKSHFLKRKSCEAVDMAWKLPSSHHVAHFC